MLEDFCENARIGINRKNAKFTFFSLSNFDEAKKNAVNLFRCIFKRV